MTDTAATASPPVEAASDALIARLPEAPSLFKFGLKLLLNLKYGALTVVLPSGRRLRFDGAEPGPAAVLEVRDYALARKAFAGGDVGFAESYMAGHWTTPDLAKTLEVFSANLDKMNMPAYGGPVTRFVNWIYHRLSANTKRQAKKNIEAHYDLGNTFYELWLDSSMTYSAAKFETPEQTLEDAQRAKYMALAQAIDLKRDQHVLEIGCGWGGFAKFAAKEVGAKVTGLTLSPAQRDYALERMQQNQLGERVEIKLQDYRDETGRYDGVASIEMFEAVGEKYWPVFFSKVAEVLKPAGRAGLQIITIRDDLFETYRRRTDFIQRYIFPGGVLPSVARLRDEVSKAGLALQNIDAFAKDYAKTLNHWMSRFRARWDEIRPLGFDERFKRLWEFYLAYCEAGFRTGRIDVAQFALAK